MRLSVSGLLVLLLALVGCSANEGTSTPPAADTGQATAPVEVTTQAEPQPAESSAAPDIQMSHESTLQVHGGGYKAQLTIQQGDLQRAQLGLANGNLFLDQVCPVDPQKDAVIPYQVSFTNNTQGFSATFGFTWRVSRNGIGDNGEFAARVQVGEAYMSDQGPMCELENAHQRAASGVRRENVDMGTTLLAPGFLILKNYYNPEHPDGDVEAARHVAIDVMDIYVNDARRLEKSDPKGGMHKLENGFVDYGVSFIPSEASRNCVIYKKVACPDL